jgi:CHRD domain
MRRILVVLGVVVGVLVLASGSALATAGRVAASPPVNSALPAISGTAQLGQTLTAANGTWGGVAPMTFGYQWQSCDSSGSSCGAIASATDQNYVASSGDVGKTIRVAVTATNSDGSSQALSAATGTVASPGSAPANTRQPNPSGTPQDGQTVAVDSGGWSGLQPIAFSYQWQSCTTPNPVCTDLAGATGESYVVGTGQVGSQLRATVTATNSLGTSSAFSNLTSVVTPKAAAPLNTSLPIISGLAAVGQTLQATSGAWSGAVANGYSYRWSLCNGNGNACLSIAGATGQSYGVGPGDGGMSLRATVTATNASGSTSATSADRLIPARLVLKAGFNAVLRPNQEVNRPHRSSSLAAGHFTAKVSGKTLTWTLTFSHLSGRPTVATLNKGARSQSGAAFKSLCRECRSPDRGTLTLTASQLDALLAGKAYVNLHTLRNAEGEIRGQINRVS